VLSFADRKDRVYVPSERMGIWRKAHRLGVVPPERFLFDR
jgi:hypothetical protein